MESLLNCEGDEKKNCQITADRDKHVSFKASVAECMSLCYQCVFLCISTLAFHVCLEYLQALVNLFRRPEVKKCGKTQNHWDKINQMKCFYLQKAAETVHHSKITKLIFYPALIVDFLGYDGKNQVFLAYYF